MAETRGDTELPTCFVIGPIGDMHAEIGSETRATYEKGIQLVEQVLEPACSTLGLRLVRADKVSRAGEIPEQVCRLVRDSEVVVADLSGGNPNVMYELGLRHSLNKLTIQLGEAGHLPFDIHAIRTIEFEAPRYGHVASGGTECCWAPRAASVAGCGSG